MQYLSATLFNLVVLEFDLVCRRMPGNFQVGGSHLGRDFNSQVGSSMQPERGPVWLPGLSDNMGTQLPGPPPLVPGQMGQGSQPPRPAPVIHPYSF